ncbi:MULTISPECIES: SAM-dependent methyltransferase [unclassified Streptomyces]|uniref:SAM-dependent methyltransferase n=1 Tax=unclassified Streptomyces TaxID=2593676 RepID=UPI00081E226D|nr:MULTISPECIES: SAM-dependent methyltransferase [unclassified Streptomyces]MYR30060.1 SAM-dependent methyltransferase [Streptomyces sp. SID4945]SCD66311.1 S-adenosyl methyltransferase [Streptomyces sp. TverLS-915]SCF48541.1 S-adenosyl methyltransferase [Streptomyces sp. LcepLS]
MAEGTNHADTELDVEVTLDIHVPHSARMYDYFLGGTTNFPPDREAAGRALAVFPYARTAARANRGFMRRATRYLAEHGYAQFLDIGTGIPTSPNLHEVAQEVNPRARVVYADNDPIVLLHAEALLRGSSQGRTAYAQADVSDPEAVLKAAAETLDFTQPVALSMNALLHFVPDRAHQLCETFKAVLPRGSALVISHLTGDFAPQETAHLTQVYTSAGTPTRALDRATFTRFFDGWDLLDPGVTSTPRWRPSPADEPLTDPEASCYGAVAQRP